MAEIEPRGKNRWLVRVYLGRVHGRTKYHSKTVHGLKKDAETYGRQIETKRDLGTLTGAEGLTLNKFLDTWLKEQKDGKIRARTYAHYQTILDLYVRPTWGAVNVTDIKHTALQSYYNDMVKEEYSWRTIKYAHSLLHQSLEHAVLLEYIPKNPTDFTTLPPKSSKDIEILEPDQARGFIKALEGDRLYTLFLLALTLGMRPSEYTALKWTDLDVLGKKISVSRTVVFPRGGGWYLDAPKTKKSFRTLHVPPTLMAALLAHKRKQSEGRLKRGSRWQNHDFIFCTRDGMPFSQDNLNRDLLPILERAKVEQTFTIYCLRHTYATLALAKGMDAKIVSEVLGHASVAFTQDTYQHVIDSMRDLARDTIEAILFG